MRRKTLALATAIVVLLTGCTQNSTEPEPTEPFTGLTLVSSTNVWGDIAKSIGGDLVEVVPIIDNFSQDPHSYEASARDQLAVNDADLVIGNGGGYDPFIESLAKSANKEVFLAFESDEASKEADTDHNHDHDHSTGNEHVWYDFYVVADFATRLSVKLAEIDSANAFVYDDNLSTFLNELQILEDRAAEVSIKATGKKVISSEPVADFLLEDLGFKNITPKNFSQAIEEELDISPKDLLEIQELIKGKKVELFVVNLQTGSVQIDGLVELANANGVAVIELSELLPAGISYFEWMENNILAIQGKLR